MAKLLTDEQLARSKTDGCVFPVRIMDTDTAAQVRATYEAVEARKGKDVPEVLSVKPHVLFPWLFELGTTPTLLDAMEDLLGPDLLLTTCAIWPKDAHDPSFVTWHQDSAYFGYDPMEVWSATVPYAFFRRSSQPLYRGCCLRPSPQERFCLQSHLGDP